MNGTLFADETHRHVGETLEGVKLFEVEVSGFTRLLE
jgi:hypothetical protein